MFWQKLKNIIHWGESLAANFFFGFPSRQLTCIGVTGTDGKTTTATLIYEFLKKAGRKVGLISTVNIICQEEKSILGLHTTTPRSWLLQRTLRKMKKAGCDVVVIEVASHAIDQKRIWGIQFEIGVLTNITREHLDYHKTFKNYKNTKLSFLKRCKKVVLPQDLLESQEIEKNNFQKFVTFGLSRKADYSAQDIQSGSFCLVNNSFGHNKIKHRLLGKFNIKNILAAVATSSFFSEFSLDKINSVLADFTGVSGRLEEVPCDLGFKVFVDFAHTPAAIAEVLTTLREQFQPTKLIHVFGATGCRDKGKRSQMGEISGELADISIITTEDNYSEDPQCIMSMIVEGINSTPKKLNQNYFVIEDRKTALQKAIAEATKGDVIVATGVGHQQTMCLGGKEIPWSEKKVLQEIIYDKKKI